MRLQQHKNTRKRKTVYILAGIVIVLFLLFQSEGLSRFFSKTVVGIATPLWGGEEYLFGTSGAVGFTVQSKRSLVAEVERLTQELTTLRIGSLTRDLLLEENKELKELLGRSDTLEESVLGVVLVRPNQTPYDTLIIDLGEEDGIDKGMRVVAYGDLTIGFVDEVFKNVSRVKLYSSPGEVVDVVIGDERIATQAEGRGNGNFLAQLPHGAEISLGDIASFPAIRTRIVGVVELIETEPQDSFQTIYIKSPVNMHELKWVQVITQ